MMASTAEKRLLMQSVSASSMQEFYDALAASAEEASARGNNGPAVIAADLKQTMRCLDALRRMNRQIDEADLPLLDALEIRRLDRVSGFALFTTAEIPAKSRVTCYGCDAGMTLDSHSRRYFSLAEGCDPGIYAFNACKEHSIKPDSDRLALISCAKYGDVRRAAHIAREVRGPEIETLVYALARAGNDQTRMRDVMRREIINYRERTDRQHNCRLYVSPEGPVYLETVKYVPLNAELTVARGLDYWIKSCCPKYLDLFFSVVAEL